MEEEWGREAGRRKRPGLPGASAVMDVTAVTADVAADMTAMTPDDTAVMPVMVPDVVVHDHPTRRRCRQRRRSWRCGQGRRRRQVRRRRRRGLRLDGRRQGHAEGQRHEKREKKVAGDLHGRLL
jgi:hypothetical protein